MQNETIVISDGDEPLVPRRKKPTRRDEESAYLRENKSRRLPRKDVVDLTGDEEKGNIPPRNNSLERTASASLADQSKAVSQSRTDQPPSWNRVPQPFSQKSTPGLKRDKSPLRNSEPTRSRPSYKHDPAVSGSPLSSPHTSRTRAPGQLGDATGHEKSKYGSLRAGVFESSALPRLPLSTDRAEYVHASNRALTGTTLPPRLTLRAASGNNQIPTESLSRRSSVFRTSSARGLDEGHFVEPRSTPRTAVTGSSILQANGHVGGDPGRRTDWSRLGATSSGQQHIDGEDSDSDNAARALRHSINAVLAPISRQSTGSETSGEEKIEKSIAALSEGIDATMRPLRKRLEGRRPNKTDDVQEAASAQLLNDVLELPAKPDPHRILVGHEKVPFPVDGLAGNMRDNDLNLNIDAVPDKLATDKTSRTPSSTTEAKKGDTLRKQSQSRLSKPDQPAENTEPAIDETMGAIPALSNGRASLEVDSLTTILKKRASAMWIDQGYLMKPALRQARFDCIQAAQPVLDRSLLDPFAAVVGESYAPAEKVPIDARNQTRSKLQARLFNSSYTQHNDGLIHFDNNEYQINDCALPKYKSIVRLGPNILAKNDRALKYMPYFTSEEDPQSRQKKELLEELQKRYDDRVETLPAQRKCGELAEFWRECLEDFLSAIEIGFQDVLYSLLHESARLGPDTPTALQSHEICPSCKTSCPREDWDDLLKGMNTDGFPRPEETKLALAGRACQTFLDVAKFSIWHIAFTASSTRQLLRDLKESVPASQKPSTLCLICYLHDCPTHGAYLERAPGSGGTSDSSEDSENDGELGHNVRQRVKLSRKPVGSADDGKCGIYCVGPEVDSRDILGLQPGGEVKGVFNTAVLEDLPAGLEDNQLCSDDCFWLIEKREHASTMTSPASSLSSSNEKLSRYKSILPTFRNNRRGPCMISLGLGNLSCLDVFREMRSEAGTVHNHTNASDVTTATESKKSQHFDHEGENSNTHHLDNRIPFIPCSHAGPCDKDAGCLCYANRTSCEWMCGCSKSCGRRYPGCTCGAKNNSVCFLDQRCLCWRLNRECDPWLCGTCGVLEVLDPVNRYNEEIQNSHCKNARLQRDVPRRTLKGKSDVQGWGLFAGEDMKKHEYIGEYKGEVVGEQESNRRGAVYHHRGLEYLFNLNKGQEIDSSRAGNKMRFINNSCKSHIINVEAKKMFCNGVQRIMLFSKKHIDAGEELFFNYGYPKSVTRTFWERDEVPGQGDKDDDLDQEAAGVAGPSSVRSGGRPRKKGVGRKISSKKQSRNGGRWVKLMPDEDEYQNGVGGNNSDARGAMEIEGVERLSGRRKRKRSEAEGEVDEAEIPADEAAVATQKGDNVGAGSSFASVPEIAESEDDDEFEDDLASQENSSTDDDEDEDDDDDDEENEGDEEEEAEATSDSEVLRRRRISKGDTRYGGESQRAGWQTRRLKAAQAAEAAAAAARPRKTRGMRSARGSWLGTGGRPPLRKRGK